MLPELQSILHCLPNFVNFQEYLISVTTIYELFNFSKNEILGTRKTIKCELKKKLLLDIAHTNLVNHTLTKMVKSLCINFTL